MSKRRSNTDSGIEAKKAKLANAPTTEAGPNDDQPEEQIYMNDDCVREVMDFLNLFDLCTMAEVCVQFKRVAMQTFAAKFRDVSLMSLIEPNGFYKLAKVRQLLYNYGHLIRNLIVDVNGLANRNDNYPKMLNLIRK